MTRRTLTPKLAAPPSVGRKRGSTAAAGPWSTPNAHFAQLVDLDSYMQASYAGPRLRCATACIWHRHTPHTCTVSVRPAHDHRDLGDVAVRTVGRSNCQRER